MILVRHPIRSAGLSPTGADAMLQVAGRHQGCDNHGHRGLSHHGSPAPALDLLHTTDLLGVLDERADPRFRKRVRKQRMPALPPLRTLVKARCWQTSKHLDLIEELLAECGVPDPVAQLAQIMESCSAQEWCDRYVAKTGRTERSYRRDRRLARQLIEYRASCIASASIRNASFCSRRARSRSR